MVNRASKKLVKTPFFYH